MMPAAAVEFAQHLEACEGCAAGPFTQCAEGALILGRAALETAALADLVEQTLTRHRVLHVIRAHGPCSYVVLSRNWAPSWGPIDIIRVGHALLALEEQQRIVVERRGPDNYSIYSLAPAPPPGA